MIRVFILLVYQRKFSVLDGDSKCATLDDLSNLEPPVTSSAHEETVEKVDASKGNDMIPDIVHGSKEEEEEDIDHRVGQSEESESIIAKISQADRIQIIKEFEEIAVSADRGDWMEGEQCASALRQLRARLVKEMKDGRRW